MSGPSPATSARASAEIPRCQPPDPAPRKPRLVCPPGTADCHVHVYGPADRYPVAATRAFDVPDALPAQLRALHDTLGVERLVLLLETLELLPAELNRAADVYVCAFGEAAELAALTLTERLRDELPGLRLLLNSGGGSFKSQFKKADKSGARYALILGDDELAGRVVGCKPLRDDSEQQSIAWDALPERLAACLEQV